MFPNYYNPFILQIVIVLSTKYLLQGNVAYVPQEAWIQNMTLRDNILFGKEYKHSRYWDVIDSCALKPDLELLDDSDNTEIGERVCIE